MTRGTTPELTFTLPFEASELTKLNIAFEQHGKISLEKTLDDCYLEGNKIIVALSEKDTLAFESGFVDIQLRCGIGDKRLASRTIKTTVAGILKDGEL